jgi:hypothetical protein
MKTITFKVSDELFDRLSKLDNKSEFIKNLITTHYNENKCVIIDKDGKIYKLDNFFDAVDKLKPTTSNVDKNIIKSNFRIFFELFSQNSSNLKISSEQKIKISEIQNWLKVL